MVNNTPIYRSWWIFLVLGNLLDNGSYPSEVFSKLFFSKMFQWNPFRTLFLGLLASILDMEILSRSFYRRMRILKAVRRGLPLSFYLSMRDKTSGNKNMLEERSVLKPPARLLQIPQLRNPLSLCTTPNKQEDILKLKRSELQIGAQSQQRSFLLPVATIVLGKAWFDLCANCKVTMQRLLPMGAADL